MYLSYIDTGLAFANICMISILLYIYWQNYRKWKSQYTVGLLVFGIFLLLQNILSLGFGTPTPPPPHGGPPPVNPHEFPLLLINASQLIALAALLKISWK